MSGAQPCQSSLVYHHLLISIYLDTEISDSWYYPEPSLTSVLRWCLDDVLCSVWSACLMPSSAVAGLCLLFCLQHASVSGIN